MKSNKAFGLWIRGLFVYTGKPTGTGNTRGFILNGCYKTGTVEFF
jgi:hypothetical protein